MDAKVGVYLTLRAYWFLPSPKISWWMKVGVILCLINLLFTAMGDSCRCMVSVISIIIGINMWLIVRYCTLVDQLISGRYLVLDGTLV